MSLFSRIDVMSFSKSKYAHYRITCPTNIVVLIQEHDSFSVSSDNFQLGNNEEHGNFHWEKNMTNTENVAYNEDNEFRCRDE